MVTVQQLIAKNQTLGKEVALVGSSLPKRCCPTCVIFQFQNFRGVPIIGSYFGISRREISFFLARLTKSTVGPFQQDSSSRIYKNEDAFGLESCGLESMWLGIPVGYSNFFFHGCVKILWPTEVTLLCLRAWFYYIFLRSSKVNDSLTPHKIPAHYI